jgi:anti-sigma-K factor RskA
MTAIDKQPARHEIEELLPWYATGTLSGRDAERVAQALAGDHELAQRYELVRRELAEATRLNETLGAPSARAMEKLFAAINAEQRDELAPLHSITSSARVSMVGEISRPMAFAVLRLITISNLVGCSTGRSPGFAPRTILST